MILDVEFGCYFNMDFNMDNILILAIKLSNWCIQHLIGTNFFISHDYQIFSLKNEYFRIVNSELKFIWVWKKYVIYRDYQIISFQRLLVLTKHHASLAQ